MIGGRWNRNDWPCMAAYCDRKRVISCRGDWSHLIDSKPIVCQYVKKAFHRKVIKLVVFLLNPFWCIWVWLTGKFLSSPQTPKVTHLMENWDSLQWPIKWVWLKFSRGYPRLLTLCVWSYMVLIWCAEFSLSTFCDQQVGDRSIINGCISQERQMSAVSPVSWIRVGGTICDFSHQKLYSLFLYFLFSDYLTSLSSTLYVCLY